MRLKSWLIKNLYCVPVLDDVIKTDKQGIIYLGGNKITDSLSQKLAEEAHIIVNTELWRLMNETIKDQASRKMFEKSEQWADMLGGKFMLYTLDLQKSILKILNK